MALEMLAFCSPASATIGISMNAAVIRPSREASVYTEVELKLTCDLACLPSIATCPALTQPRLGDLQRLVLTSVYYDTTEHTLHTAGVALRVRFDGANFVMTTKTKRSDAAILTVRTERSVPVKTFELEQSALAEILPETVDLQLAGRPLVPVFTTEICRQRSVVATVGSVIEVAIDRVKIVAGDKTEELGEIELELKEGTPAGLFEIAQLLNQSFSLRPTLRSKSSRGFDLATGARPRIAYAPKIRFLDEETVEDVLRAIFDSTIYYLLVNQPAAEDGLDVEGLHQYRVALRRLRSLLSLMRLIVPSPELDDLCEQAKKLMQSLANARDWDVFIHETLPAVSEACAEVGGFAALKRAAADMQHAARDKARSAIVNSDNSRFQIATSLWLQKRPWREDPAKTALMEAPARKTASKILEKLHCRVIKRGRHFANLTAVERHRLRIAVKKLRYAADFFLPLFRDDKAIQRYTKALWRLQDQLGIFNDAAVTSRLVQSIKSKRMNAATQGAAGAAVGWQTCRLDCQAGPLNKVWQIFRDLDIPV
jgi:triphosphatase